MTSTYNKRPSIRGKVYESLKSSSAPAFVEWIEPSNYGLKLFITAAGLIPFAVLSLFNWLIVEDFGLSKLGLMFLQAEEFIKIFTFADVSDEGLMTIRTVLFVSAAMFAAAVLLIGVSMAACKTKARVPLAYTGFGIGAASPLLYIITMSVINRMASQRPIEATVFAYLTLLTGAIALIYCVKYPSIGVVKDRRNGFFTRFLTSLAPAKGDGVKESVRKIVFTGALISFLYFGLTLGVDLFNEWRATRDQARKEGMIGEILDENDPTRIFFRDTAEPLEDYLALFRENNDMVGYIRIGDTRVNYPVLQTTNNSYYLNFDFYGRPSRGGAIFADFRNTFEGFQLDDNTVLYGHNIDTGNYFAALSNYHRTTVDGTLSFYKTNPTIRFDTMFEHLEWKVFGAVLFNTQSHFGEIVRYWDKHNFADEDDFHNYIFTIMDRSVLFTDVDLQYGDRLLTLSTCYWPMTERVDTRLAIFARQVRPGESSYVDVDKASFNRNVLRFTEEARRYGSNWTGQTVWDYATYLLSYDN
jgi:sortase B